VVQCPGPVGSGEGTVSMDSSSIDVTVLLKELSNGNQKVLAELIPVVYDELRRLAAYYLRRERSDHTLQATALVHEAYLRLVDQRQVDWKNRNHFFGVAAQLMRRVLLMHAREHHAEKRGGGVQKISLEDAAVFSPGQAEELVFLDELLTRLAALDPQQARIVEFRFFAGLSVEETADLMKLSSATVKRDWAMAKAWLAREMARHPR
jgi:RNA polymerase sigma-70 factor, ECF subfamily